MGESKKSVESKRVSGDPFLLREPVNTPQSLPARNFRFHFIEGSLYLASFALINVQVVFPALVIKLGGGNIAVGTLPVLYYLLYFLPQVLAANYAGRSPYRRSWVLSAGLAQRIQILVLALIVLLGKDFPSVVLVLFFISFGANQIIAGLSSPQWFDYLAKTTLPHQRGRLMGLRSSVGALMGFANGAILTMFLAYFPFPWDYGATFFVAFLYQLASWIVLRKVSGEPPSEIVPPLPFTSFFGRISDLMRSDRRFRLFLIASALSVIGLMPAGFFTVAALKRFSLPDSFIGFFTMTFLAAQVLFGGFLGWIADRKGHKSTLLICSAAMLAASVMALLAQNPGWFFAVFALVGMLMGMEMITRYNFAGECATEQNRPLYIGIMNAWLAPFYLSSLLGGWVSDRAGYETVFAAGGVFSLAGFLILARISDPSKKLQPD